MRKEYVTREDVVRPVGVLRDGYGIFMLRYRKTHLIQEIIFIAKDREAAEIMGAAYAKLHAAGWHQILPIVVDLMQMIADASPQPVKKPVETAPVVSTPAETVKK